MQTEVSRNLDIIFARKKAAVLALCLEYAALILEEFRKQQVVGPGGGSWIDRFNGQGVGEYWNNQTENAARMVFSDAFMDDEEVGFYIAHMVEYGVYLELANDRRHEALRPLIEEFYPRFRKDLEAIYAD